MIVRMRAEGYQAEESLQTLDCDFLHCEIGPEEPEELIHLVTARHYYHWHLRVF